MRDICMEGVSTPPPKLLPDSRNAPMVRAGRPGGDTEPSLTKREKGGSSRMADLSNDNLSHVAKLLAEQPDLDPTARGRLPRLTNDPQMANNVRRHDRAMHVPRL